MTDRPISGCLTPHHEWQADCERCRHHPPPWWYETVEKSLRSETVPGLCDEDGCGYPLIDALSDDGGSVGVGIERASEIASDVAFDLWQEFKRRDFQVA